MPGEGEGEDKVLEQKAISMGWIPKERFRSDPEKFVGAAEYVRRGEEVLPILRHTNAKLAEEVGGLKTTVNSLQGQLTASAESLKALVEYNADVEKKAYERALRDLKLEKREAIREGNHDKAADLEEQIDELTSVPPKIVVVETPKTPPAAPQLDPVYLAWAEENKALLDTLEKQAYATSIAQYVRAKSKATGREFLDEVAQELKEKFDTTPPPRSKVEGGGPNPGGSRGKTYNDLPVEAKEACERFSARMVGAGKAFKTADEWRKRYVSQYDWS